MKVFLTVGTQLGFDRLIRAVDLWAKNNTNFDFFAQIGEGAYKPVNMSYVSYLCSDEYDEKFSSSDIVVSHAGMGTIISASLIGKPVIIMPRDPKFGEHRNSHQIATCKRFESLDGCYIADNESELYELLNNSESLTSAPPLDRADKLQCNLEEIIRSWF